MKESRHAIGAASWKGPYGNCLSRPLVLIRLPHLARWARIDLTRAAVKEAQYQIREFPTRRRGNSFLERTQRWKLSRLTILLPHHQHGHPGMKDRRTKREAQTSRSRRVDFWQIFGTSEFMPIYIFSRIEGTLSTRGKEEICMYITSNYLRTRTAETCRSCRSLTRESVRTGLWQQYLHPKVTRLRNLGL